MALILLAEDESSTIDHVRSVLASQGWLVKTVKSRAQALRAASEFAPQLVLLNDELKGVDDLVRTFSRRSGGPGVVLLSAKDESSTEGEDVEAVLTKPVRTEDLIATIKDNLSAAAEKKASTDAATDVRILSTEEIFGDLLDDILDKHEPKEAAATQEAAVEEEALATEQVAAEDVSGAETEDLADLSDLEELAKEAVPALVDAFEAQARKEGEPGEALDVAELLRETAPPPTPAEPEREPIPTEEGLDEDLEAKLSDTLAGVFAASLGATTEPEGAPSDEVAVADVDLLLSSALGDLDIGDAAKRKESVAQPEAESEEELVAEEDEEPEGEEAEIAAAEEEIPEEIGEESEEAEPAAEPAPTPVIEFGEFALEERIGIGGMAEVWKARRQGVEGFEKRVAVKKILPQPAENQDFVDMFIDEAKLAAQLNHPNITHIYDLGKVDDDYFIAMEYVEGRNLRHLLDAGSKQGKPLPAGLALFVASRIADALDYAHRSKDFNNTELGLVHRDVSPHNVLISHEGDIKLCDFGIAKAVSKISTTQMGALKGKIQYMSPEQAWGRSIDHRSDIFSTGTLLYEMLTAKRLFTGDSELSVLEAVRECETAEKVIQDPAIPARVKGLLLKVLAKEPEERFETAGELLEGLTELLAELDPTPGQREMGSYVRELLDLPIETVRAEAPDVAAADVTAAEPIEQDAEQEVTEAGEVLLVEEAEEVEADEAADQEASPRPGILKWLSRLLPVVALVAIGGYLIIERMDSSPGAQPSTSAPSPIVPPTQVFRPEAVEADLPTSVDADSTTTTDAESAQTAPPAAVRQQPTAPPPALATEPEEPSAGVPAGAASVGGGEPTTQQAPQENESPAVASAAAGTGTDSELERRVEEDLQRVQELISTPEFVDGQQSDLSTLQSADSTEPAPEDQKLYADDVDASAAEVEASTPTVEEIGEVSNQTDLTVDEEANALDSAFVELDEGPSLITTADEPPEASVPEADSQVADTSPDLPIAPPLDETAATQPGDLVEPGPGVVEPRILSFQPPAYSAVARRVGVSGTVRVAVLVDESGQVVEARLVEGLRQRVGLDEETLAAARRATFQPATKDGVPVKMWHELAVQFQP